jgi:hypothetical protein
MAVFTAVDSYSSRTSYMPDFLYFLSTGMAWDAGIHSDTARLLENERSWAAGRDHHASTVFSVGVE